MIKILFITLIFISTAWSSTRMELQLNDKEVHQGALVRGKLFLHPQSLNLPLQKLKGATLGETVYFHQLTPLFKKNNSENYESEIQIIFLKPPESQTVTGTLGEEEVMLETGGVRVIPVEAPGQMLWAEFSAPDFLNGSWMWLWISLVIILSAFGGYLSWKKLSVKNKKKLQLRQLAQDFKACATYEDVVSLWQRKRKYLEAFPHIEQNFTAFEEILFRYQFKPRQSDEEKETVLSAYKKMIEETEGGFRGI